VPVFGACQPSLASAWEVRKEAYNGFHALVYTRQPARLDNETCGAGRRFAFLSSRLARAAQDTWPQLASTQTATALMIMLVRRQTVFMVPDRHRLGSSGRPVVSPT
jgi:hypothetical protein